MWLKQAAQTPPEEIEDEDGSDFVDDWREGLLPICYNGCQVYTLLDCTTDDGPVLIYDDVTIYPEPAAPTLRDWLEDWLNEPRLF